MASLKSIYRSISCLYNTMLRGNEIEFSYAGHRYFILPVYSEKAVVGVALGEADSNIEKKYFSYLELQSAHINGNLFSKVFGECEVLWNNF